MKLHRYIEHAKIDVHIVTKNHHSRTYIKYVRHGPVIDLKTVS